MNPEGLLLELLSLAEEVIERGPGEGRALRMAGLVLRLNEVIHAGEFPLSWHAPMMRSPLLANPSIRVPTVAAPGGPAAEPDIDAIMAALDAGWDEEVIYIEDDEIEVLWESGPMVGVSRRPPPLPRR